MTIKIVTDTGSDMPPEWLAAYDIHLVPLVLRFGDREVEDNETTRAELWQRVEAGLPCETSGPPVGAYEAAFAPLIAAGHQVLCITLPAVHSVTYNSAWVAAQSFPGQVEVVDGHEAHALGTVDEGCHIEAAIGGENLAQRALYRRGYSGDQSPRRTGTRPLGYLGRSLARGLGRLKPRTLLAFGAAAEHGIEPQAQKGRDQGHDDDLDSLVHFTSPCGCDGTATAI